LLVVVVENEGESENERANEGQREVAGVARMEAGRRKWRLRMCGLRVPMSEEGRMVDGGEGTNEGGRRWEKMARWNHINKPRLE
jgi:hypothetical protein